MIPIISCRNCKHLFIHRKCSAFPIRIPTEILIGKNAHNKPLKNQGNDIVFEPIEK